MFQFIKHTGAQFGEHRAAARLGIPIEALGDGFTWLSKHLDRTTALASEQGKRCKHANLKSEEDIVVLDEFTYSMHYGWVPVDDVIDTLSRRPEPLHVIITGRYVPRKLMDCADVVTAMKLIKHPYEEQGIRAQQRIES